MKFSFDGERTIIKIDALEAWFLKMKLEKLFISHVWRLFYTVDDLKLRAYICSFAEYLEAFKMRT